MMKWMSFLAIFFSFQAMGSLYMKDSCLDRFEGIAVEVEDLDEVDHLMAKIKVKLEITQSNSAEEYLEFKHLKHSLIKIEKGKEYLVGMNSGKLCLLEEIRL